MTPLPQDPLIEALAALTQAELRIQTAKRAVNEAIIAQGEPRSMTRSEVRGLPCTADVAWDEQPPVVLPSLSHPVAIPDETLARLDACGE